MSYFRFYDLWNKIIWYLFSFETVNLLFVWKNSTWDLREGGRKGVGEQGGRGQVAAGGGGKRRSRSSGLN